MERQDIVVRMKTPSGAIVPFEEWIETVSTEDMRNDIKKMLILLNKATKASARSGDSAERDALETTYFTLLLLLYPIDEPLPVKNEVEGYGEKGE